MGHLHMPQSLLNLCTYVIVSTDLLVLPLVFVIFECYFQCMDSCSSLFSKANYFAYRIVIVIISTQVLKNLYNKLKIQHLVTFTQNARHVELERHISHNIIITSDDIDGIISHFFTNAYKCKQLVKIVIFLP